MIIISDTSVITNLAAIKKLELFPQLYQEIIIPQAVYDELVENNPPVPGSLEVQTAQWLEVKQVSNFELVKQLRESVKLDPGESEAITLAIELNADLLLIDERRGRKEADRLGVRIIGLLGVLVEAKTNHLIVEIKPLLDAVIANANFRVSPALYEQILTIANEL